MKIEIYFLEGKFPHCVVALDNLIISPWENMWCPVSLEAVINVLVAHVMERLLWKRKNWHGIYIHLLFQVDSSGPKYKQKKKSHNFSFQQLKVETQSNFKWCAFAHFSELWKDLSKMIAAVSLQLSTNLSIIYKSLSLVISSITNQPVWPHPYLKSDAR